MDGAEGIGWFFVWLIVSLATFSLLYIIILIILWIIEGIIINKLHKEMYGKATALAWVPFCNIYLLGKLTVNKTIGWALAISKILTYTITTTVNGVQKTYSILPSSISTLLSGIVGIITFCLLIYAIVKYKSLEKSNNIQNQTNIAQQPTYQQPVPQQQVSQQTVMFQQSQQPINNFCTNCGAKFNGNEAFCTNCGTPRQ
ncbi:MAG: zinc ribbon domain-containing protein [Tenericutes bacterium]|nr:zinc ribbon domain-containing protein [Mycoplasmatota bacterium]